jgi:SAM-dependent methyltransferase
VLACGVLSTINIGRGASIPGRVGVASIPGVVGALNLDSVLRGAAAARRLAGWRVLSEHPYSPPHGREILEHAVRPDLDALCNLYRSDKGSQIQCAHQYSRVYEKLFAPLRDEPLRILEIGLARVEAGRECPSLRVWLDYFPNAQVFGFDIEDHSDFVHERARVYRGDQGDPATLRAFKRWVGGPMDIIIDDGSHYFHHQQTSLANLFDLLKPGGLYIIEDLHVRDTSGMRPGMMLTKELIRMMEHLIRSGKELDYAPLPGLRHVLRQTHSIELYDSLSGNTHYTLDDLRDAMAVFRKAPPAQLAMPTRTLASSDPVWPRLEATLVRLEETLRRLWERGPFPTVEVPLHAEGETPSVFMGFGARGGEPALYVRVGASEQAGGSLLPLLKAARGERHLQGRYRIYLAALAQVRRLCEQCVTASRAQAEAMEPMLDAAHITLVQLEADLAAPQVHA